jgi:hypothetical protein
VRTSRISNHGANEHGQKRTGCRVRSVSDTRASPRWRQLSPKAASWAPHIAGVTEQAVVPAPAVSLQGPAKAIEERRAANHATFAQARSGSVGRDLGRSGVAGLPASAGADEGPIPASAPAGPVVLPRSNTWLAKRAMKALKISRPPSTGCLERMPTAIRPTRNSEEISATPPALMIASNKDTASTAAPTPANQIGTHTATAYPLVSITIEEGDSSDLIEHLRMGSQALDI